MIFIFSILILMNFWKKDLKITPSKKKIDICIFHIRLLISFSSNANFQVCLLMCFLYIFLSKLFSYMCNKKKGSITQPERQRFDDWYVIVPLIMDLFILCQPFGQSPFCTLLIFWLENGFQFFPFTQEIKIYPGIEGFQYLPKCTYIVNLCMLWEEKWFSIFVTSEKTH